MDWKYSHLGYQQTGFFSKIVLDYISQAENIQPFYKHPNSLKGMKDAIEERKLFNTDRVLLYDVLKKQYANISTTPKVENNIESLLSENTFTICTAHQPNIFTGPLYFIYKILHAVKIAEWMKEKKPENNFVPVYYMGSEDADLEELGHFFIEGQRYEWITEQSGAVGRMKVDKALVKLIEQLSGQLLVYPYGAEILAMIQECYADGQTIEQATFQLVNKLFADYGVVILLPDNAEIKRLFIPVIENELLNNFSSSVVEETAERLSKNYKVQASGRALNMFYLLDGQRERIEREGEIWTVLNTNLKFNREELIAELNNHPENFSPNVILRPVLQEWILPNIAFIGGGGEIAYWLQLKNVFEAVNVPYPVLVVRNSLMLINKEINALIEKLSIDRLSLFTSELDQVNQLVKRDSALQLSLEKQKQYQLALYEELKTIAGKVDITLQQHTEALQVQSIKKIDQLEKKMLRTEKKKFEAQNRQLHKIRTRLFPNDNLQERVDNMMFYYAKWGNDFIKLIYENSPVLEQHFTVLTEN
ncbi:MAG: bacillithiol biosynthesis cysteine-adding enzyme BshC [Ferruginibacter sp.]